MIAIAPFSEVQSGLNKAQLNGPRAPCEAGAKL